MKAAATLFKPRFPQTIRFSASRVLLFCPFYLCCVVYVKEGEACEIDDNTRPALDLAAKLLGVEGDMLEKAMVSKMMAVRGWSQAGCTTRALRYHEGQY